MHRSAELPTTHLARSKGVLHVKGYAGFEHLTSKDDVALTACSAHTRRKFYKFVETGSG
ncbi:transposase [Bradyrhizobium diazoefficiens]|uniref:IS66 family transposase n=1 Tax=Bradyrhizobium diazoefficiens TaxID=1355477 RepID=UPI00190ADF63|nr:transposase [Bradyrhizobium diazoefficiens]QQO37202.1 transposase [Bradyrhizobium diazoefficiens]